VPGVGVQAEPPGRTHAYHLFPILVEHRAAVFAALASRQIRAQVHYIPVHRQPLYRARYGAQRFPGAESWYERVLSIPMFPSLGDDDVQRVCEAVATAVHGACAVPAGP
jgi:dTDP-4-amino-4,6-dideoxygalactose transaminase